MCTLAPDDAAAYGVGMPPVDLSGLRGQRVLVTGAARGIGAALAERLASHGARLALVGLEPETTAAVAARCGADTFVAECDVSSNEQVTQAVDAAAEALGGLDVVVANAGIATGGPLRSQDLRSWERVIEINLLGVEVGVAYFLFLDTDMVRDAERESPLLQRAKAEMPRAFSRTYPLSPAIDEVVAAIAQRRRRVAFPRWFLKILPLRQVFASRLAERRSARTVPAAIREYEQLVAERGASAASASERTRQLARL
jgi:NADPH:quinone reductase-like Zn-dependent oxidoreductase